MSIEQKIAQILAESKAEEVITEGENPATKGASAAEGKDGITTDGVTKVEGENPDNKKNNVEDEKEAEGGTSKKPNEATKGAAAPEAMASVKEDVDALFNGEEGLTEEFRQKAETIFEAAVVTRVKAELARIEEETEQKLAEQVDQIKEGLVEKVDGYLDYVVEKWMAQNEIALEHGIKSEILEGFVAGMKSLFEEHYIDIPEEKYDVLGSMEQKIEELSSKLDEQVAANVDMKKSLSEMKRAEIVKQASVGLTDTEADKFQGLAEELSYEDEQSFQAKVQTIRENYFNTKAQSADVKSVVTDAPVETLTEDKKVDPQMAAYLNILNRK
jgi:hypothetical protein